MHIALTPELERRVADAVASGQFSSPEEAVAEALHLLLAAPDQRFAWIDDEIRQGIEAADRGEFLAGDEVRAERATRLSSLPGQ
jgi:Arc/MetJ-type ribon-helix-helix transcriptional regulator